MAQSYFDKKSISQILTKYLIFVRMFQKNVSPTDVQQFCRLLRNADVSSIFVWARNVWIDMVSIVGNYY